MALKLGTSCAERRFCFIAILISVFSATLRAQTARDIDAYQFSSSIPLLSVCGQAADNCSPNALAGPQRLNQDDADGSNPSHTDDWVHSWLRK